MATAGRTDITMIAKTDDALNTIERFAQRAKAVLSGGMTQERLVSKTIGDGASVLRGGMLGVGAAVAIAQKGVADYAESSERAASEVKKMEESWKSISENSAGALVSASGLMAEALSWTQKNIGSYFGEVLRDLKPVQNALETLFFGNNVGQNRFSSAWQELDLNEWNKANARDSNGALDMAMQFETDMKALEESRKIVLGLISDARNRDDPVAKAAADARAWAVQQKKALAEAVKGASTNSQADLMRQSGNAEIDREVARRISAAESEREAKARETRRKEGEAQDKAWEQHQDLLEQLQNEREEKMDYLQLLEQESKIAGLIAAGKDKQAKQASLEFDRQKELTKLRGMELTYAERKAATENINSRFDAEIAGLSKPEQDKGGSQAFGFSGGPRALASRVFAVPGTSSVVLDENRKQTRLLEEIRNNTRSDGISRFGP